MRRAVLMMRQAISPRLAIRMRLNMPAWARRVSRWSSSDSKSHATGARPAGDNILTSPSLWNISALTSAPSAYLMNSLPRPGPGVLNAPRNSSAHPSPAFQATFFRRISMALAISDTAPDFEAETTEGKIRFHDWIGDNWARAVLAPEGFHAGLHHRARLHGASSSRSSTSAASRSSACRSIRSRTTPAGPPTSRRRRASRRTIR